MKHIIIWSVLILIALCGYVEAEISQEPRTYEATFTIKFNSITLNELTDIERALQHKSKEACTFKLELKEPSSFFIHSCE